jgi:hypothetical protein
VLQGVAIDLRCRGEEERRGIAAGELEELVRPLGVHQRGLDGVREVAFRARRVGARRAREVGDGVDCDIDWLRDVLLDERKVGATDQVRDVRP